MKVYLSVDMEGIAGVVHELQTDPTNPAVAADYARSCRFMTGEANAAIQGALDAGATRVVVNDSHWLMRNLIADELHPAAELISGSPKPLSMMEGVQEGFDAACFIGYHGQAGTGASVIDHTYTDKVYQVRVNGRAVGELALNAAVAGCFSTPVAFASGDNTLAAEAREFLGDQVGTVAVKQAISRYAARSLSPERARAAIRTGVTDALKRPHPVFTFGSPVTIETDYARSVHADMAELLPGAERVGARTVRCAHDDYLAAFRAWRAMYSLAGAE
jgi:D-amino peptidase